VSQILFKRNTSPGVVPTTSELALGELAINTFDGALFTKVNRSGTEQIVTVGGQTGQEGTIYVAKNGNDDNDGLTSNSSVATIAKAAQIAADSVFSPVIAPADGFYSAISLIKTNREFIQKETIAFVNSLFPTLEYNEVKCERDVGLIIDAMLVDLEFGGNEESVFAGRSYLNYIGTVIEGEVTATSSALAFVKTTARQVARNSVIGFTYQTNITQTVDETLTNGVAADSRIIELIDISITAVSQGEDGLPEIIENQITIVYQTIKVASGDYTEINPIQLSPYTAIVGDSLRTVTVRPTTTTSDLFHVTHGDYLSDMTFSGHTSPGAAIAFNPKGDTFLQRSVEAWRSPYIQNCTSKTTTGTGMRVDGSVAGGLRSMVVDSYTQYNEGGIGVHLLNRGYAQLVSVFTICCQDAFLAESGGFCSITNSNSSFGTNGLRATGVSKSLYSGTTLGATQIGNTITVDGLIIRPNVGDAVKFAGDDFYYTIDAASSLFETVNAGSFTNAAAIYGANAAYIGDYITDWVDTNYPSLNYDTAKCKRDVGLIVNAIAADLVSGGVEESDKAANAYWAGTQSAVLGQIDETAAAIAQIATITTAILAQTAPGMVTNIGITAEEGAGAIINGIINDINNAITRTSTGTSTLTLAESVVNALAENTAVSFHQRSLISASSHTFEFVGTGNQIELAVPYLGGRPIQENEVIEDANGAGRVNFTSTDQRGDFRIGQELVIERATGTISGRTFNRSLFAVMTPYILAIGD
jgi:hypothetical protein